MNIYESLTKAMAEVEPIGKNKINEQQKFRYRGVDDVMNALQPVFVKYHIFAVPEVLEQIREERKSAKGNNLIYSIIKTKYTFYAEDGSSVSAVVVGEGMDSADKASNKAMAVAFKYACFQLFCIPTEETAPDPDGETPDVISLEVICPMCGLPITPIKSKGKVIPPEEVLGKLGMCYDCYKQEKAEAEGQSE